MDGPVEMLHKTSNQEADTINTPTPKRRRVSIFGILFRIVLAVAIFVGGAGFYAQVMIAEKPEPPKREPRERTFTVQSFPAQYANYQPA